MFRVQATSKQRKLMYAISVYTLFESKENSLHRDDDGDGGGGRVHVHDKIFLSHFRT